MFDTLTQRLAHVVKRIGGQGRITEDNIKDTLREVRMALLEADVALPVIKDFIDRVRAQAVGAEVLTSLTPGQAFVKIVHDELVRVIGEANEGLDLAAQPPAVILMAGLQGSGKTTTTAKLARWLKDSQRKRVLVVSADIYRPAAIEQLKTLAAAIGVEWFPSTANQSPLTIAAAALDHARKQFFDVLLIDTAGRLHIDGEMMAEIKALHAAVTPVETLFVVDAMTGQDAANTAKAFHAALPLTGVILTKTDGDARGGAALSIRHITGKPIKFLGVGEKTEALQPFHPERLASRILGMGDVVSLVEEMQAKVDHTEAARLADKLHKGKGFDLDDFLAQIRQMKKMGGMTGLMDKLPGMATLSDKVKDQVNDKELKRIEAIILSMTYEERRKPDILKGSRKRRIAAGSGTQVQDVNRLLKQFMQMQDMMKQMTKKGGLAKLMRQMQGKVPGLPFGG